MLIERISAPQFTVADPDTMAEFLRITPGTDEATTDLLLASACEYIQGLTGRVIVVGTYAVTFDDFTCTLPLDLFPINSVTSVVAKLADGSSQTLVAGTDYRARITNQSPQITLLNVPAATDSIVVTVNAGYRTFEAVPASIQHAAQILVAASYDGRAALDPGTIGTVANLVAQHRRSFT